MPWTPPLKFLPCLVALASTAAFTACENTIPSGASYVVSVPKAGFYKYGPAQTFGPDLSLDQDTRLTILQHGMGFSRVVTSDGTSGYISNDDIKPAPPATPTPQESAQARSRLNPVFGTKTKPSNMQPVPGSPLFENNDLPPLPDNGTPKPKPGFRF